MCPSLQTVSLLLSFSLSFFCGMFEVLQYNQNVKKGSEEYNCDLNIGMYIGISDRDNLHTKQVNYTDCRHQEAYSNSVMLPSSSISTHTAEDSPLGR